MRCRWGERFFTAPEKLIVLVERSELVVKVVSTL